MESIVRPTALSGALESHGWFSVSIFLLSVSVYLYLCCVSVSIFVSASVSLFLSLFLSLSLQGTVKSLLSTPVPQLFSKPQHLPSAPHSSAGRWVQPAQCPSKPPSPPPATQCPFTQGLHSALCCISNSWREKLPGCLRPGISLTRCGCGHMDRAF